MEQESRRVLGSVESVMYQRALGKLCNACELIDFQAANFSRANGKEGYLFTCLGDRLQFINKSECDLCRLFNHVRFPSSTLIYNLWAYSGLKCTHAILFGNVREFAKEHDSIFFAVLPECEKLDFAIVKNHCWKVGYISQVASGSLNLNRFSARLVSAKVEYDLIKTWLNWCQDHHSKRCGFTTLRNIKLKFIDCETLKVLTGSSNDLYVALSYVWGAKSYQISAKSVPNFYKHLSSIPKVVKDAAHVAKLLGYQYLWVDRFCIDQSNNDEKQLQMDEMHEIYQAAAVTIIAAAGEDDEYGLVGVSDRLRSNQLQAITSTGTYASTLSHPSRIVKNSKWSSRGWTYQEAFFSRRRLVFTEEQVYFECHAMNCQESLHIPINEFHVKDKSRFRHFIKSSLFEGKDQSRQFLPSTDPSTKYVQPLWTQFSIHVENYTARQLTKDEDSLNAFRGIIQHFANLAVETSVGHSGALWALLLQEGLLSNQKSQTQPLVSALTWRHVNTGAKPRRRIQFPSWSWTGWEGKVVIPLKYTDARKFVANISIDLTLIDGSSKNLGSSNGWSALLEAPDSFQPILQINAAELALAAFQQDSKILNPRWTIGEHDFHVFISLEPRLENAVVAKILSKEWRCLVLGSVQTNSEEELLRIYVLVVENVEIDGLPHACSRIGTLEINNMKLDDLQALPKTKRRVYQVV